MYLYDSIRHYFIRMYYGKPPARRPHSPSHPYRMQNGSMPDSFPFLPCCRYFPPFLPPAAAAVMPAASFIHLIVQHDLDQCPKPRIPRRRTSWRRRRRSWRPWRRSWRPRRPWRRSRRPRRASRSWRPARPILLLLYLLCLQLLALFLRNLCRRLINPVADHL